MSISQTMLQIRRPQMIIVRDNYYLVGFGKKYNFTRYEKTESACQSVFFIGYSGNDVKYLKSTTTP